MVYMIALSDRDHSMTQRDDRSRVSVNGASDKIRETGLFVKNALK